MLRSLTNTNCEMKSMEVYSELFAMPSQLSADANDFMFSTDI